MIIKIRKAENRDIPAIWELEKEGREVHKKITPEKYSELNKARIDKKEGKNFAVGLKKDLAKKKKLIFVAECENKVVGYVYCFIGHWSWSDNPPKTLRIEDICVLKTYQKSGVATKLLNEVIKIAEKNKVKFISLNVWLKNKVAIDFYKRNKFEDFSIEMIRKVE